MEQCAHRDEASWPGLLGEQWLSVAQMIANESDTALNQSATQIWALKESLRKCGAALDQSLQLDTQMSDAWTILSSGEWQAATFLTSIQGFPDKVAFAFVTRRAS
jgi:enediyne polyketide synthase